MTSLQLITTHLMIFATTILLLSVAAGFCRVLVNIWTMRLRSIPVSAMPLSAQPGAFPELPAMPGRTRPFTGLREATLAAIRRDGEATRGTEMTAFTPFS